MPELVEMLVPLPNPVPTPDAWEACQLTLDDVIPLIDWSSYADR